jgi:Tetratricopeptide repeat.
MKKALSIFFLLLSLLAFKNIAYAQQEIDACRISMDLYLDYKSAIAYGKLAVKKYPKNPEAYRCLGRAYSYLGGIVYFAKFFSKDSEKVKRLSNDEIKVSKLAIENFKKAASLTKDKKDLMEIYRDIGLNLVGIGSFDEAISYFNKSLNIAKDLGDTEMQIKILNDIANAYYKKGELDKAIAYIEKTLSLQKDERNKANIYHDIASKYIEKGDFQKAVEYFQKATEIHEKYGDYLGVSSDKLNIGNTYRKMKDYEKAEKYLFEGLEGFKKEGYKEGEAYGYFYFGLLYKDKGDKEKAKEYYTRAYDLFKSIRAEGDAQRVLNEIKELDKSK